MNCNKQKKTTIHLFAAAMLRFFLELLWFLNNFEDDLRVILRQKMPWIVPPSQKPWKITVGEGTLNTYPLIYLLPQNHQGEKYSQS